MRHWLSKVCSAIHSPKHKPPFFTFAMGKMPSIMKLTKSKFKVLHSKTMRLYLLLISLLCSPSLLFLLTWRPSWSLDLRLPSEYRAIHSILTERFANDKLVTGVLGPVSATPMATDAKGIEGNTYAFKNKNFVKKRVWLRN